MFRNLTISSGGLSISSPRKDIKAPSWTMRKFKISNRSKDYKRMQSKE